MRAWIIVPTLLLAVGCNRACRLPCCPPCPTECCKEVACPPQPCPEEKVAPRPAPQRQPARPAEDAVPCLEGAALRPSRPCPPEINVDCPKEVHVNVPRQKVVVEVPHQAPQAAPQQMPMQMPVMAPQQAYAPGVPQYMPAMAAPQAPAYATSVQTVSAPRDRVALGLDWVRIPLPLPKLFAVPGRQEVVTTTQFAPPPTPVAYPVAMPQAPVYAPMPVAAPPMQMIVPQAPVQAAPVQMQMVVPQAPVQAMPVQAMPVQAAPPQQAPVDCWRELEDCYRRVQELEATMHRQKGGQ